MAMGRHLRVLMAAWTLAGAAHIAHAAPVVELAPKMGVVSIDDLEAVVSVSEQPPPDTAAWRPVRLPDRWAENGRTRAGTVWYRLRVHVDPQPNELWAFEVAYATMNSDLWVNGMLVGRAGRMDPDNLTRHWKTPLLFMVPPPAWKAADNMVYLRVRCAISNDGGLGHLFAGPVRELSKAHERRVFWRISLLTAADAYIFALGVLFAGIGRLVSISQVGLPEPAALWLGYLIPELLLPVVIAAAHLATSRNASHAAAT